MNSILAIVFCAVCMPKSDGFTVRLDIDLTKPAAAVEKLYSFGPAELVLRQAGADAKLAGYDRSRGNYLNFRMEDGSCPVLEATIVEKAGRVGIPLGLLKGSAEGVHSVTLQYDPPRWAICVEGNVDEDFPIPAYPVVVPTNAAEVVHSPRVRSAALTRRAASDAIPRVTESRAIERSIQYWTPSDFNVWVGDVAPAYLNGRLHVFYLSDRRHHMSGNGTGRHQFAHLSSDDLVHWSEHPFAVPITETWQTCGTGTPFLKDGKLALAFGWHSKRYPQCKGVPLGGTYAISEDGVHFRNSGVIINDAQNPSVYNLPDGRYELVTSYGGSIGIFRSTDLLDWKLHDAKLPFRGDCPSLFEMNGHRYLLQGFTNMAYSATGAAASFVNWTHEPDSLYEGLSVPMVSNWKDGRRLYIGWLNHLYGWGGWLVFREVVSYPDGHLGLKWVPEIAPPVPPREYALSAGEKFSLVFKSASKLPDFEFSIDPSRREASFLGGGAPERSRYRRDSAGNVVIGGVRGLDRDYRVRLIQYYDAKSDATIFDAEIAGQRTLICRRPGKWTEAAVAGEWGRAPNGEFWNGFSTRFIEAPAFGFKTVDGAAKYVYEVTDDWHRVKKFDAPTPTASLKSVWKELPVGYVTVVCRGVAADGTAKGEAGRRTFWKKSAFDDSYPQATKSFGLAYMRVMDAYLNMDQTKYLFRNGRPDPDYYLSGYPSKMLSSQISALVRYANNLSGNHLPLRDKCLGVAKRAADYLIAESVPAGQPLAYFTRTYANGGEYGRFVGQEDRIMLIYPAQCGSSFVTLYEATKDAKYLEAAERIAATYMKLQGKDGTWFLLQNAATGKEYVSNRLQPQRVIGFFEDLFRVTGKAEYRATADRAFAFIEKGALRDWNWEGQFEDIRPATARWSNLTKHAACETATYLLERFPGDATRLAQAEEIVRFSEDQFVEWTPPYGERAAPNGRDDGSWKYFCMPYSRWMTPCALEQYHCYNPIDASADRFINTYLALWRVTKKPVYLAKARALGATATRMQESDGFINTWWIKGVERTDDRYHTWVNCMLATARALNNLAMAEKEDFQK